MSAKRRGYGIHHPDGRIPAVALHLGGLQEQAAALAATAPPGHYAVDEVLEDGRLVSWGLLTIEDLPEDGGTTRTYVVAALDGSIVIGPGFIIA